MIFLLQEKCNIFLKIFDKGMWYLKFVLTMLDIQNSYLSHQDKQIFILHWALDFDNNIQLNSIHIYVESNMW